VKPNDVYWAIIEGTPDWISIMIAYDNGNGSQRLSTMRDAISKTCGSSIEQALAKNEDYIRLDIGVSKFAKNRDEALRAAIVEIDKVLGDNVLFKSGREIGSIEQIPVECWWKAENPSEGYYQSLKEQRRQTVLRDQELYDIQEKVRAVLEGGPSTNFRSFLIELMWVIMVAAAVLYLASL